MRDRAALILKVVCLGLAAWLAWELVHAGRNANPLAQVTIPDVPTLPADTNAPPATANKPPPLKPGANTIATGENTNGAVIAGDTNAAPRKKARAGGTNAAPIAGATDSTNIAAVTNATAAPDVSAETNSVIHPSTNESVTTTAGTNAPVAATTSATLSNHQSFTAVVPSQTNASGSNLDANLSTNAVASGTNIALTKTSGGTNLVANAAGTNAANSATAKASSAHPPNPAALAAMMGGPGGKAPAKLPPEIQARVNRVYESEIFAPIMHPMPMALLGIAGNVAFLRGPSGQTGLVKEGDNLGDVKLLRIGTNRVLVEQDGKKQELMIFSGLGGESLISKTNDSSNETTKH